MCIDEYLSVHEHRCHNSEFKEKLVQQLGCSCDDKECAHTLSTPLTDELTLT